MDKKNIAIGVLILIIIAGAVFYTTEKLNLKEEQTKAINQYNVNQAYKLGAQDATSKTIISIAEQVYSQGYVEITYPKQVVTEAINQTTNQTMNVTSIISEKMILVPYNGQSGN